jgi:uncharacterized surface protein with fasciclin (FAS1) repeats
MGKMRVYKKLTVCASILTMIVMACVKNSSTPVITPGVTSITGYLKNATNLSILDSAMSKAGLLPTFDSLKPASVAAPFTFFAPTNIAFSNIGFTDSSIYKSSADSLKVLMAYHVIGGDTISLSKLLNLQSNKLITIYGDSIFVSAYNGVAYINGNAVAQTDIKAGNGVIQSLTGVLIPPYGKNIYQLLQNISTTSDTTLTWLVAAINQANNSTAYPNFSNLLASGSISTFFAPTNAAFRSFLGDTLISQISNENPDTLARILQCHLVSGRYFLPDFPYGGKLYSYANDSLVFTNTINASVKSPGNNSAANITTANRIATNGVIHKVDQVLYY